MRSICTSVCLVAASLLHPGAAWSAEPPVVAESTNAQLFADCFADAAAT